MTDDPKNTTIDPAADPAADPKLKRSTGTDAEQVVELIREMRSEIGDRHTDLQGKLDELDVQREKADADFKVMREELEKMQATAVEREKTITEIERRNQLRVEQDPAIQRTQALELMGMMGRRELCRHFRIDMPERFASVERERVDTYMKQRVERATLDEQTTQGGYFVPTMLQMEIYDTLDQLSQILSEADMQTGVPSKASWVTLTGRPTLQAKRASSNTKMTQSDPTFGTYNWDTDEAYIYFPVDNWMLELSPIALGQKLLTIARDGYMEGLATWLVSADGSAAYNSNTGILNDAVKVVRMAGNTFESLTNADLRKLMRGVISRARGRGSFLGGPYMLDVLEDVDRQGKVPILRENTDGTYRVKGHRFIEDESMPDDTDSGANSALCAFGDMKTWTIVMAARGLQLASDPSYLFANGQTAFRAAAHIDIVRKPGETWALLKTKA